MRPVVAVALLVLSAIVAAVPSSHAQQPGPTAKILWAHGAAPAEGETLWANFDKEDAASTDTANGPGYNCGVGVPVVGQAVCDEAGDPGVTDPQEGDIDHTFTLPMDPALAVPIEFTAGSKVGVTLYFGASTGTGSGNAVVKLMAGDTVVAESGEIPFAYDQGYEEATGEADVMVTSVAAGAELVWTIDVTGTATGFFLGIHDDNGKSHLTLPIASGPGSETVEALTGATVDIQRTFNTTTNETLRFTWPSPNTSLLTEFTSVGNGTASFDIKGQDNVTRLSASQTNGTGRSPSSITTTGNGTWNITITVKDFNGTVRLTIKEGTASATGTSGSGTSTSPGNDTKEGGGKGTPAVGLPLVLGTMATVALVRRRWSGPRQP